MCFHLKNQLNDVHRENQVYRDAVNNINKLAINKVSLLSPYKIINYSLRLIVLIGLSL